MRIGESRQAHTQPRPHHALELIEDDELDIDRRTVVVDETSMVGTPDLKKLHKTLSSTAR